MTFVTALPPASSSRSRPRFCEDAESPRRAREEAAGWEAGYMQTEENLFRVFHLCRQFEVRERSRPSAATRKLSSPATLPRLQRRMALRARSKEHELAISVGTGAFSSIATRSASKKFVSPAAREKQERACKVLESCMFFRDLASLDATIYARLSAVANFVTLDAEQVIFRQGDEAKSCYVLVSGAVGCFKKPPEESARPCSGRAYASVCSHQQLRNPSPQDPQMMAAPAVGPPRCMTLEGFSSYSLRSSLGAPLCELGAGSVFGELALMHDDARAASIKCLQPCEVLVIHRLEFAGAVRYEMLRNEYGKMKWFEKHVSGFSGLPKQWPHPTYYFHTDAFQAGHQFLAEGTARSSILCVVLDGSVVLSRCVRGRGGKMAPRTFDTLREGAMFCSLGAIPLAALEPFTATVASPTCTICYVGKTELEQMPKQLVNFLRVQLVAATKTRLQHVSIPKATGRKPIQTPRSKGPFKDFRDAPKGAPVMRDVERAHSAPCLPKFGL